MKALIAIVMLPLMSGCSIFSRPVRPVISTPPAMCANLIPKGWRDGVKGPGVPGNADVSDAMGKPLTPPVAARIAAPWANAYVGASNAIDKANGRTTDTIDIIAECERQANAARPK